MAWLLTPISVARRRPARLYWDIAAGLLVAGGLVFLASASRGLIQPLAELKATPISLDPSHLPIYALRTTGRMLAGMVLSLLFTFTYATAAARSKRAELLLVPLLDILQSVPILGFISVTVVFFLSLAPGRVFGAELAAVFAIFTSQAWNMAFSFYQSLRTIPVELTEASVNFGLSPWMRFWRLDVPFAMPSLIWNMMMSMSGGWFFVVASEVISVGHTTITLPGIGSYIALAIAGHHLHAIGWAIGAMLAVILLYDQLLFRPLVAWAERFRFDSEPGVMPQRSVIRTVLLRSGIIASLKKPAAALWRWSCRMSRRRPVAALNAAVISRNDRLIDRLWAGAVGIAAALALWTAARFVLRNLTPSEVLVVFGDGALTMLRVMVLIGIASLVWVPAGVYIGINPKIARIVQPIAQFMAAFPANILFPVFVSVIVALKLNPDIWLSPLMILGTQWYILFNVVAGASAIPAEFRDTCLNLRVRGWLWWSKVALPAVLPYYLTGAITASGGSWNASIVAEVASWGDTQVKAHGLGAYIAQATASGDFPRIVLGIGVMSLFVLAINRSFWRPLYRYAERKFRFM